MAVHKRWPQRLKSLWLQSARSYRSALERKVYLEIFLKWLEYRSLYGCFCKLGVLHIRVLIARVVRLEVHTRSPDFLKLPWCGSDVNAGPFIDCPQFCSSNFGQLQYGWNVSCQRSTHIMISPPAPRPLAFFCILQASKVLPNGSPGAALALHAGDRDFGEGPWGGLSLLGVVNNSWIHTALWHMYIHIYIYVLCILYHKIE